ncbi:anthranilate phosphoribosyltransferase [bacterium]|nr:anthranilate phosphoribosyltransferase [bacterium]
MTRYLEKLIEGDSLTREDTHGIMLGIVEGKYNDCQTSALLMAIQAKGITVDELLGFRDGILETGRHVDLGGVPTIDIVGTGGDGKNSFNISTCAAFVMAGAGYKVSKHGNGGSTSVSGASNVLAGHGVKFTDDEGILRRSLDEAGICYLHAPLFALGMKWVAPVRKAIGIPTCFNLLGPLVNPCSPKYSLHGTANQTQMRLYTNVHQKIGDTYSVVTSYDGYDEISLTSGFKINTNYFEKVITPIDMGFKYVRQSDIYGGDTQEEARRIFDSVLENTSTEAQKNVVIANAACGISIMEDGMTMADTIEIARDSIESGKALEAFRKFLDINS